MLRTLRGPLLHGGAVTFPFGSRARPEKPFTLLSGLFVLSLHRAGMIAMLHGLRGRTPSRYLFTSGLAAGR